MSIYVSLPKHASFMSNLCLLCMFYACFMHGWMINVPEDRQRWQNPSSYLGLEQTLRTPRFAVFKSTFSKKKDSQSDNCAGPKIKRKMLFWTNETAWLRASRRKHMRIPQLSSALPQTCHSIYSEKFV
eukprot:Pompholyxophrys_punicea_v1_NODE_128_length_3306_cov_6.696401.p3 type:complete len:128 gc:universal NODE_128_length_3306_cov_6.696401:857-474(-)